jgi:hypothetical protein
VGKIIFHNNFLSQQSRLSTRKFLLSLIVLKMNTDWTSACFFPMESNTSSDPSRNVGETLVILRTSLLFRFKRLGTFSYYFSLNTMYTVARQLVVIKTEAACQCPRLPSLETANAAY